MSTNKSSVLTKSPNLFLVAICALKLSFTIFIWREKANQISFLEIVELANSTLTDWLWTILPAYLLVHYIGAQNGVRFGQMYNASLISVASTTSSVIIRRSQISIPMERFLLAKDYQHEIDMGMMEGNRLLDPVIEMYLRKPSTPSPFWTDQTTI